FLHHEFRFTPDGCLDTPAPRRFHRHNQDRMILRRPPPSALAPLLAAAAIAASGPVQAQSFPSRAVKVVVPTSPGGATDAFARALLSRGDRRSSSRIAPGRTRSLAPTSYPSPRPTATPCWCRTRPRS